MLKLLSRVSCFQIYDVACRRVNELNNAKIFRDGGVDYSKSNLRDLVKNSFERNDRKPRKYLMYM